MPLTFLRWSSARILFYPTLGWNLALHRLLPKRNWWDRIDEHVLMGALPFASDANRLHAQGVRGIVNTCEEYAGPQSHYEPLGMIQLRIPTVDFMPPSLEDIEKAVGFMHETVGKGHQIYVHCKAGRGRSATVVLCWLVAKAGMTVEEAQAHLLKCRAHVNPRLYRRKVVIEFSEKVGRG